MPLLHDMFNRWHRIFRRELSMWYTLFFIYRVLFSLDFLCHFWFISLSIKLVHGCNVVKYKIIFVDYTSTSSLLVKYWLTKTETRTQARLHSALKVLITNHVNLRERAKQNVSWMCLVYDVRICACRKREGWMCKCYEFYITVQLF